MEELEKAGSKEQAALDQKYSGLTDDQAKATADEVTVTHLNVRKPSSNKSNKLKVRWKIRSVQKRTWKQTLYMTVTTKANLVAAAQAKKMHRKRQTRRKKQLLVNHLTRQVIQTAVCLPS